MSENVITLNGETIPITELLNAIVGENKRGLIFNVPTVDETLPWDHPDKHRWEIITLSGKELRRLLEQRFGDVKIEITHYGSKYTDPEIRPWHDVANELLRQVRRQELELEKTKICLRDTKTSLRITTNNFNQIQGEYKKSREINSERGRILDKISVIKIFGYELRLGWWKSGTDQEI